VIEVAIFVALGAHGKGAQRATTLTFQGQAQAVEGLTDIRGVGVSHQRVHAIGHFLAAGANRQALPAQIEVAFNEGLMNVVTTFIARVLQFLALTAGVFQFYEGAQAVIQQVQVGCSWARCCR